MMIEIHGIYLDSLPSFSEKEKSFIRKGFSIVSENKKQMVLRTDDCPVTVTITAKYYWDYGSDSIGESLEDSKNKPVSVEIDDNVVKPPKSGYLYRPSENLYFILLK